MKKKNKKKKQLSTFAALFALPLILALAGGVIIGVQLLDAPPRHPTHVRVAVKDAPPKPQEKPVPEDDNASILQSLAPEYLKPFKQPLQLSVNDLKKPPDITPQKESGVVITDVEDQGHKYEESGVAPEAVLVPQTKTKINGKPKIALVIDDMGVNQSQSERATRLPATVTLSYLPYAHKVQEQVDAAKSAGHEIMLHLPMQPMGADNPGPNALMTDLSVEENMTRLDKNLNGFRGYDGINNHMGSKFTAEVATIAPILKKIQDKGLFFVDSRTSGKSVADRVAAEQGMPHTSRDVFLDDTITESAIQAQLKQTERVAKQKGTALAIGHPHPETLKLLESWIVDVQARGFELVPVRNLVK